MEYEVLSPARVLSSGLYQYTVKPICNDGIARPLTTFTFQNDWLHPGDLVDDSGNKLASVVHDPDEDLPLSLDQKLNALEAWLYSKGVVPASDETDLCDAEPGQDKAMGMTAMPL